MVFELPQELLDCIMNTMSASEYDKQTLLQCSLVSHSFCASSQPVLFSAVELGNANRGRAQFHVVQFLRALSSSPHLAGCVKTLVLRRAALISFSLQSVLPLLTHVRRLALVPEVSLAWASIPPSVNQILLQHTLPGIESLAVEHLDYMPSSVLSISKRNPTNLDSEAFAFLKCDQATV